MPRHITIKQKAKDKEQNLKSSQIGFEEAILRLTAKRKYVLKDRNCDPKNLHSVKNIFEELKQNRDISEKQKHVKQNTQMPSKFELRQHLR